MRSAFRNTFRVLFKPEVLCATVATATFPFALLTILFQITPSLGDDLLDAVYEEASPGALSPKSYSVLGGISYLFSDGEGIGDRVVAVVLLMFSVFFPTVKLALSWWLIVLSNNVGGSRGSAADRLAGWLEAIGPWSMADVFVVSVLLLSFKSFPGNTKFTIELGYYLFLISVVFGLFSVWLTRSRLMQAKQQLCDCEDITCESAASVKLPI
jgi:hypothetical protein